MTSFDVLVSDPGKAESGETLIWFWYSEVLQESERGVTRCSGYNAAPVPAAASPGGRQ